MNKKSLKDLVPLVVICLVAALLLAGFNLITKGPIEQNTLRAAEETRTKLLSSAVTFEEVELEEGTGMNSCHKGLDADGNVVGYVVQTSVNGYGGEVVVTVGMDASNVITGINVGGENFAETAGLGALAKEAAFTDQYMGKSVPLKLVKASQPKGDDTIDAISGATITSTAVNGGVNLAGKFLMDLNGGSSAANTASVQGFAGPVAVTLELDASGAISAITIGDDFFNETEGFGKKALEESFQAQFIGMRPPLALSDIDAIAGATITSQAVVDAINMAYGQMSSLSASVQGFAGPVAVTLKLDENGAISSITIGDDFFNETEGFGKKALEESFQAQFIGKVPPLALSDIDAIAGATITSQAVVDAINAAHATAGGEAPVAPAAPAQEDYVPEAETVVKEASSEIAGHGSVQGFAGPVAVAIELDENGAICAISIGDENFTETEGFGKKALENSFKAQFIGKVPPLQLSDIDAIAGATVTSQAVVDAVNIAYEQLTGDASAEAEPAVETAAIVVPKPVNGVTASAQGFAGPVAVTIELDENGAISAIEIGDENFAETEGFGKKALEDAFQAQFIGKVPALELADIDAIAGATITSQAVVDAINAAAAPAVEEPAAIVVPKPVNGVTASAQGFAGPVAVTIELDENGAISAIEIGDENFAETEGFGKKALEAAFQAQFIGKVPALELADIDAIAGATVTSQAVVDAINAAAAPAVEEPAEDAAVETTVHSAIVPGFSGPMAVTIELDANGAITSIVVGNEAFKESKYAGGKVQDEAFTAQFIGMVPPIAVEDIDGVAGATTSTKAVVKAINAAAATAAEVPAVETTVHSAIVPGFSGPMAVTIELDANGAITSIVVGNEAFKESKYAGGKVQDEAFTAQFIGMVPPIAVEDIDGVAGATTSTKAVVNAINAAAAQ